MFALLAQEMQLSWSENDSAAEVAEVRVAVLAGQLYCSSALDPQHGCCGCVCSLGCMTVLVWQLAVGLLYHLRPENAVFCCRFVHARLTLLHGSCYRPGDSAVPAVASAQPQPGTCGCVHFINVGISLCLGAPTAAPACASIAGVGLPCGSDTTPHILLFGVCALGWGHVVSTVAAA